MERAPYCSSSRFGYIIVPLPLFGIGLFQDVISLIGLLITLFGVIMVSNSAIGNTAATYGLTTW